VSLRQAAARAVICALNSAVHWGVAKLLFRLLHAMKAEKSLPTGHAFAICFASASHLALTGGNELGGAATATAASGRDNVAITRFFTEQTPPLRGIALGPSR